MYLEETWRCHGWLSTAPMLDHFTWVQPSMTASLQQPLPERELPLSNSQNRSTPWVLANSVNLSRAPMGCSQQCQPKQNITCVQLGSQWVGLWALSHSKEEQFDKKWTSKAVWNFTQCHKKTAMGDSSFSARHTYFLYKTFLDNCIFKPFHTLDSDFYQNTTLSLEHWGSSASASPLPVWFLYYMNLSSLSFVSPLKRFILILNSLFKT